MKRIQKEPILLLNSILNNANYEVMRCILVVVMIASEEVSGKRDSINFPLWMIFAMQGLRGVRGC